MNPLLGVSIIIAWMSSILAARFLNMSWSLFLSGAVMSAFFGILAYVRIVLQISPKILDNIIDANRINRQTSWIERILDRENSKEPIGGCAPIFSRNIDKEINAIIDNALEDFEWLLYLLLKNEKKGSESSIEEVKHLVKRDLWFALSQLNARLSRVEKVRLLANDVVQKVTEHFAQIRLIVSAQAMSVSSMVVDQDVSPCSGSASGGATSINYPVHSFLKDEESENLLLSKIADLLVLFLLPIQYTSCIATRPALCQVLAKKLFRPAVEYLTSPSAINQFILGWLQCDEADNAHDVAKDTTTDDAFQLKMSLKQQRLNILADIVQATSKLDSLTDDIVNEADEDEMQMREQIAHLVRAKAECEDKLQALGMDCKQEQAADKQSSEGELLSFSTVQCKNLSFATIMTSGPFTRRYFYQFLEHLEQQDLLGFWAAIEELKVADRTLWHQLGTEIFYTYINKPFSKVMRVERSVLKRIEDHLLGDSAGPDVFYELQAQVIQDLENKYYPAFLISDTCYQMLEEAHENNICIDVVVEQQEQLELNNELKSDSSKAGGGNDQDEFQYDCRATTHLDHIKEKLQNKSQALKALQGSLKSDSKVLKMLQGQVETLEERKIQVEQHLQRTEAWTEFLGLWRCHVQTVEYFEEEEVLKATLIVHVPVKDNIQEAAENPSWICTKNVQDFQLLHKELLPYCSWLKGWLPSSLGGSISSSSPGNSLINFATRSSSSNLSSVFPAAVKTEKTRNVLQRYMDALLSDERLNQSENVFHFLSPSPAFLKKNNENHRKIHDGLQDDEEEGKLFPKIFKNTSSRAAKEKRLLFLDSSRLMKSRLSEEDHDVLADLDSRDAGGHGASSSTANSGGGGGGSDGVAEPFYGLISEVFDMRGVSKILRKSLMTFVQLTYGRTITSYITSYIAWMTSDRMIIKYIKSLRQSLWPSSSAAVDSDLSEQEKAKDRAKEALINHIPDWLAQLVGTQSSKNGVAKVFDTLQEKTLNKMLLYDLVEIVMYNLFPEVLLSEVAHSKG